MASTHVTLKLDVNYQSMSDYKNYKNVVLLFLYDFFLQVGQIVYNIFEYATKLAKKSKQSHLVL